MIWTLEISAVSRGSLDMGQCNDTYGAIKGGYMALAEAFWVRSGRRASAVLRALLV